MSQLEIIGAGFGRTGTYSLKTALEILGYPCHHMETVALEGQGKIWAKIVKGENVEVKLKRDIDSFNESKLGKFGKGYERENCMP